MDTCYDNLSINEGLSSSDVAEDDDTSLYRYINVPGATRYFCRVDSVDKESEQDGSVPSEDSFDVLPPTWHVYPHEPSQYHLQQPTLSSMMDLPATTHRYRALTDETDVDILQPVEDPDLDQYVLSDDDELVADACVQDLLDQWEAPGTRDSAPVMDRVAAGRSESSRSLAGEGLVPRQEEDDMRVMLELFSTPEMRERVHDLVCSMLPFHLRQIAELFHPSRHLRSSYLEDDEQEETPEEPDSLQLSQQQEPLELPNESSSPVLSGLNLSSHPILQSSSSSWSYLHDDDMITQLVEEAMLSGAMELLPPLTITQEDGGCLLCGSPTRSQSTADTVIMASTSSTEATGILMCDRPSCSLGLDEEQEETWLGVSSRRHSEGDASGTYEDDGWTRATDGGHATGHWNRYRGHGGKVGKEPLEWTSSSEDDDCTLSRDGVESSCMSSSGLLQAGRKLLHNEEYVMSLLLSLPGVDPFDLGIWETVAMINRGPLALWAPL